MNRIVSTAVFPALIITVLFLSGCTGKERESIPVSFNDDWYFIRQDSANIDQILPGNIPNHKWEQVTLPHTAFIEPLVVTGEQWTGICWYKKIYRVARKQRHRHTGLLFDGAMNDAIVYLNGAEVSRHTGGYLPFYVDLSEDLQYGKENEILIRLDNRDNPAIPPGKPLDQLDFLWYSGLYRNVSLFVTDRLHITAPPESQAIPGGGIITGVRDVSREAATLTVSVDIRNDDRIPRSFSMKNTLLDAAGIETAFTRSETIEMEPGQSMRLMTKMIVMHPALWSPDKPFLYTLTTELISGNDVIDRRETRTGLRSVRITSDRGLIINSEPLNVTGTNRHQEYPYIGYALSDNASYRDAFRIREAGFNLVRCSHYPPAPAFLDACDELGLLVIDAIPGWQFMGDSLFREASLRDTRMMCRRDRNHPSIILWEASWLLSMMLSRKSFHLATIIHAAGWTPYVMSSSRRGSMLPRLTTGRSTAGKSPCSYVNTATGSIMHRMLALARLVSVTRSPRREAHGSCAVPATVPCCNKPLTSRRHTMTTCTARVLVTLTG